MNTFNRLFVALLGFVWLVGLAGILYLVWNEDRTINIDTENLVFNFDIITSGRAEQILASFILGSLAIPALGLLAAEFLPRRGWRDWRGVEEAREYARLQVRADALQEQLANERQAQRQRADVRVPDTTGTRTPRQPSRFLNRLPR
jgi:hypothetical protein